MVSHIVVTEGLVFREDFAQNYFLSNYFEEVLKLVLKQVSETEKVYISPGNCFDCPESEEDYAAKYLINHRPELRVFVPKIIKDRPYLDTFDNARLLRKWLETEGKWPLDDVILYCNKPHGFRSKLMFKLCGYKIQSVMTSVPEISDRKMPPRLWFYDYLPANLLYEWGALVYNLIRFYPSRNNFKN
jgi:hypothetical protein